MLGGKGGGGGAVLAFSTDLCLCPLLLSSVSGMVDEEGGLKTAGTGRACCMTHTLQQGKENLGRDGGGEGQRGRGTEWEKGGKRHMTSTWLSHDCHMTHLPEHALPCLPLQQGTMSGDSGEECLRGTLADSCTVINTQVRQTSGGWCG